MCNVQLLDHQNIHNNIPRNIPNGLFQSLTRSLNMVSSTYLLLIGVSLSTSHASTAQASSFTLPKLPYSAKNREAPIYTSSDLIDVYRSNDKLILRCGGINQTLEFSTSNDHELIVEKTPPSNLIEDGTSSVLAEHSPGIPSVYQSSYERIFGIYKLPLAYCIAFIKSSEPADSFLGGEYGVRRVKEISYVIIPTSSNKLIISGDSSSSSPSFSSSSSFSSTSSQSEQSKQKEAITLMQNTFSRHSFYFSSSFFDVTRNFQSNIFQFAKSEENSERDYSSDEVLSILVDFFAVCSIWLPVSSLLSYALFLLPIIIPSFISR